ncbi:MAG TPA: response regulator [Anaerolineae bacterium]|jgi:DNA-binding response OmpR family regulator|nr:response regulator [Anaerolineae bacterium]
MAKKPLILAVERNRNNILLLDKYLGEEGYEVIGATGYERLDEILEKPGELDLALVDITGFDKLIWDRCEILRSNGIPFLLISPRQSVELQKESIARGARGLLTKPIIIRELLVLIQSLIEE